MRHLVELQRLAGLIAAARTRLVVLTTDAPAQNLRIAKRLGLTMPTLSDPEGAVLKPLGMWDARWRITSYGYYFLDAGLGVISRRRGYWDAGAQELVKLFEMLPPAPAAGS